MYFLSNIGATFHYIRVLSLCKGMQYIIDICEVSSTALAGATASAEYTALNIHEIYTVH